MQYSVWAEFAIIVDLLPHSVMYTIPPPLKKDTRFSAQATSTEADASKTFEEKRQPRSKSLWVLSSLLHFSGEASLLDA